MSAHLCKTLTDGCYRCDLNRDEIESIQAEDREDAQAAWLAYRGEYAKTYHLNASQIAHQMRKREFIAGFLAGRQA